MKEITRKELLGMVFGGDQTQKAKDLASFENPDNVAEVLTQAISGENKSTKILTQTILVEAEEIDVDALCGPVKVRKMF
jgi:hypothetical protein